jgi:hypothetical protein
MSGAIAFPVPSARVETFESRLLPASQQLVDAPAPSPVTAAGAAVVGRYVFYNHSAFDGRRARPDARDDAAIAPDKAPLLPGAPASAANFTSYARGINGVMVDVAGLPAGAPLSPPDFTFRAGNDGAPGSWRPAPAPRRMTTRPSPAAPGATRVTLTWRDRAVRNAWLEVTVNATAATGLPAPDFFLFGNLAGDAVGGAGGAGGAEVSADDVDAARSNPPRPAAIDDPLDFDRNGRVNRADARLARRNLGARLHTGLTLGPAAPVEPAPPPLPGAWSLAFRDEFAGQALEPVWHTAQYWDHDLTVVGEGELQAYDPTGVSAAGGMLRLTARPDDRHGVPYVSGLAMTGGEAALPASPRFGFLYGYLEVRAKVPAGKGLWPAIWMMPASFNDDAGEIDVLEVFGDQPSHARFTVHRGHPQEGHGWDGPDLSADFHTYAVDWQPDHVAWFVDGVERARTTRADLVCREAMYVILNLAVGGPTAGRPTPPPRFPRRWTSTTCASGSPPDLRADDRSDEDRLRVRLGQ